MVRDRGTVGGSSFGCGPWPLCDSKDKYFLNIQLIKPMLRELHIKDFAIIHDLRVQFDESLNILTGETGAGKSIVIGALGLLLGERADMDFIRTGQDTASVEGLFDCANFRNIFSCVEQAGIELNEDQLLLKRIISRSGRNKIYINGCLSTLAI